MLGIVIVTYNAMPFLVDCLASVARHAPEGSRVVVVDNGSTDGTLECLEGEGRVQVVANLENRGFAAACNQGVAALEPTDALLFLNPDVIVEAGSIERLLEAIADPRVGIAGPTLIYPSGELQANGRTIVSPLVVVGRRTPLGKLPPIERRVAAHLAPNPGLCGEVDWLIGACLMMRREAFVALGRFDERFFLYFEDVDLCYRAWRQGLSVVRVADAHMVHVHRRASASGGLLRNRTLRMHLASGLKFFGKHPRLALGLAPRCLPSRARLAPQALHARALERTP